MNLTLRCACGAFEASLDFDPTDAMRVRCHCDDCQAYARHLGAPLPAHGGTSLVQTWAGRLQLPQPATELAVLRLTDRGLFRWYTRCCRSPLANTLGAPRVAFVGLIADRFTEPAVLHAIGPEMGCMGRFAPGGSAPDTHPGVPLRLMARTARLLPRWTWRGGSPWFRPDGTPLVPPEVLAAGELAAARDTGSSTARN